MLDIRAEGMLHKEIKDIVEELDIMLYIATKQKIIVEQFIANANAILKQVPVEADHSTLPPPNDPNGVAKKTEAVREACDHVSLDKKGKGSTGRPHEPGSRLLETGFKSDRGDKPISRKERLRWFNQNAKDLMRKFDRHVGELELLSKTAQSTGASVRKPDTPDSMVASSHTDNR